MISLPKAYCGYNQTSRAYVPYTGNLTQAKETIARERLISWGYRPGWKASNVQIEQADKNGLSIYREDGAGGVAEVKVFAAV